MENVIEMPFQAQWANYFLNSGYEIIPVFGILPNGSCSCGAVNCTAPGKHPMKKWEKGSYFDKPEAVREFWQSHPNANYAILTAGLFVLDIDERKGGVESFEKYIKTHTDSIKTLTVRSGSGGDSKHLYFSDKDREFNNDTNIFPGIDVRATGGYIIGVGSKHVSGNVYQLIDTGSTDTSIRIAELPEELKNLLNSAKTKKQSSNQAKNQAANIFSGKIHEGSRNDSLASYAGTLRHKGLSEEEISHLLLEKNKFCVPPLENEEVLKISKSVGRYAQGNQLKSKDPQPLFRELPAAAPFPIKSLGKILAPAVGALIKVTKTPPALSAQAILAAATLAVQPFKNVCIDGRTYPICAFFITIGETGERKTAADNEALKPHRDFEYLEIEKYNSEVFQFKNDEAADSIQRKRIANDKKVSKEEINRKLAELGPPPSAPLARIMLIQEPTFEGLLKLLEHGKPSVGLFSDEGGRMVGGHGMNTDNQLKTMSGFCSLWDGKPISRVRAETGSTNLYGKRFSIHLMFQPIVAQQLTGNSLASEQGFLSRCLISYPESTVGTRTYEERNISQDPHLINYHNVISDILKRAMPFLPNKKNELQPEKIELNKDAKNLWIEFHNFVENNLAEGGEFYSIRGFGAKAAEHVLRLAAVLTLIENINANIIDKDKMQSAIELVRFYLSEALRLYSVSAISPDLLQADKLLRWCYRQGTHIHIGHVYKNGPNSLRDKKSAKKIIDILQEHGHLIQVAGGMEIDGKHRNQVWKVEKSTQNLNEQTAVSANPAVFTEVKEAEPQKPQEPLRGDA